MSTSPSEPSGPTEPWNPAIIPPPLEKGNGRTRVRLELLARGRDLVLNVGGGEAHVGAVAVATPAGPVALTVVPGHKEGPLAEAAATALARAAGCTCAVVAGIHQDRATAGEIADIVVNVEQGVAELVASLDRLRRSDP